MFIVLFSNSLKSQSWDCFEIADTLCSSIAWTQRVDTVPIIGYPGSYEIVIYKYKFCHGVWQVLYVDLNSFHFTDDLKADMLNTNFDWPTYFGNIFKSLSEVFFKFVYDNTTSPLNEQYWCNGGGNFAQVSVYYASCWTVCLGWNSPTRPGPDKFKQVRCHASCCELARKYCYDQNTGQIILLEEDVHPLFPNNIYCNPPEESPCFPGDQVSIECITIC